MNKDHTFNPNDELLLNENNRWCELHNAWEYIYIGYHWNNFCSSHPLLTYIPTPHESHSLSFRKIKQSLEAGKSHYICV